MPRRKPVESDDEDQYDDIPAMRFVPKESRESVYDILTMGSEVDIDTKTECLQSQIQGKALRECLRWLEEQEEEDVESEEEEVEEEEEQSFLELLSDKDRQLAERLMNRKDFVTLEILMMKKGEEVRHAFQSWLQENKPVQPRAPVALPPKPAVRRPPPPPKYRPNLTKYGSTSTLNTLNTSSRSSQKKKPIQRQPVNRYEEQPEEETASDISEDDGDSCDLDSTTSFASGGSAKPNGIRATITPDFFDRFPETLNILILGETGVGKSTFINGLVNYLKYEDMDEALKNDVEILIKASFAHTDEDYNQMRIECEPTMNVERSGEHDENEDTQAGQSSTQFPKSYVFAWGPRGSSKAIRIIDTPGVGDVRGADQEKINMDRILSFIADYSQIHAICILLKPNEDRLTLTFRYCINELLSHLHVSASKNIIFCFTNARQTFYRPGDTLPTLQELLKQLKQKRGINIPLSSKTMYCFDNESFRFLCALRQGAHFSQSDIKNFNGSWLKTVEETFRMFKQISELPVHNVNDTLSVNNIRSVILALARPLAEIAKNQLMNVKLIDDKLREIQDCMDCGKDLEGKLYVDQVKLTPKELDYPITVCTAKSCVDYQRLGGSDENMKTVYKTECHPHCYLEGVQVGVCPNPALQNCAAFNGDIDCCTVCSCPWNTHMHLRYRLEELMEKTLDPTVQKSINNRDDQVKTAQLFIEKETKRKEALQAESEKISKYCVEFAAFLKTNSILAYNDAYKEYVEHLIKEEKDKVSQGGSDKMLKQLQKYKDEYEQQVKILETHGNRNRSNKPIEEIYRMVEELKRLKNCGEVVKAVQNLDMISVRSQQTTAITPVNLNTGWLGKLVKSGQKAFKRFR